MELSKATKGTLYLTQLPPLYGRLLALGTAPHGHRDPVDKELKAHRVRKVPQVPRAHKGPRDLPEVKDPKDLQARTDPRERKVPKARKERRDPKALKAHKEAFYHPLNQF